MQVPCSCDMHHRCALAFCEGVIPRAKFVGGARQVTCPDPALHEVHQEVGLCPLLQQARTIGRSVDTPDERVIRNRVTAAELRLRSRTHIAPERVGLSRSATERTRRTTLENGVARSYSHERMRHMGSATVTWTTKRGPFSTGSLSTGDVP